MSKPQMAPLLLMIYGLWKRLESAPLGHLISEIRPDQWIIDCGAHFGYYTKHFNQVVAGSGKVLAIEPNPSSVSLLKRRQRREGWSRIAVSPSAAWSSETSLALARDGPFDVASRVSASSAPGDVKVSATTIDRLVATLGIRSLYMIKVDVEGAELEVLKGARATLEKLSPLVVCEIGNDYRKDVENYCAELFEFLSGVNYTCRMTDSPSELWTVSELVRRIVNERYVDVLLVPRSSKK